MGTGKGTSYDTDMEWVATEWDYEFKTMAQTMCFVFGKVMMKGFNKGMMKGFNKGKMMGFNAGLMKGQDAGQDEGAEAGADEVTEAVRRASWHAHLSFDAEDGAA